METAIVDCKFKFLIDIRLQDRLLKVDQTTAMTQS